MDNPVITPEQIEFAGLKRVNYAKLPWEEKVTVMWSWLWRQMVVSAVTGTAAGFLLLLLTSLIMMIGGRDLAPGAIMAVFLLITLPVSFLTVHPLIGWLLSSRLGAYRIILCRRRAEDDTVTLSDPPERRMIGL
jgi:hypothetical protein